LVSNHGLPFYCVFTGEDESNERITGINTNFWAAFLGGDKRLSHSVVFYLPEQLFYFLDVPNGRYVLTSEGKLLLGISLALQEIAAGLNISTANMLLETFQTKAIFHEIIEKAKSLLAADVGFFSGSKARERWGAQHASPVKESDEALAFSFVTDRVVPANDTVLPIGEAVTILNNIAGEWLKKDR
jgi:hypothetical protein